MSIKCPSGLVVALLLTGGIKIIFSARLGSTAGVSQPCRRSKNPVLLVMSIKCPGGLVLALILTGGIKIIFSVPVARQSATHSRCQSCERLKKPPLSGNATGNAIEVSVGRAKDRRSLH